MRQILLGFVDRHASFARPHELDAQGVADPRLVPEPLVFHEGRGARRRTHEEIRSEASLIDGTIGYD